MKVPTQLRSARALVLVVAALLMPGSAAVGQADTEAPGNQETVERCRAPVHRAFDFWLGSWEVRNAEGELVGHNEIERVVHGCALLESWHGAGGGHGISINTYDDEREKWTQRWVGDGATLWLEGGLEGEQMVLAGTSLRSTSRGDVLDRVAWTPLPDGRVSQVWEVSTDGGESWQAVFVGYYTAAEDERGATAVDKSAAR